MDKGRKVNVLSGKKFNLKGAKRNAFNAFFSRIQRSLGNACE